MQVSNLVLMWSVRIPQSVGVCNSGFITPGHDSNSLPAPCFDSCDEQIFGFAFFLVWSLLVVVGRRWSPSLVVVVRV